MFVFTTAYEFDWPVTVRLPEGGGYVERRFTARFRLIAPRRAAEFGGDARALLDHVLVGWQGITAEGGGLLQVTDQARQALLDHPAVLLGLAEAYADALSGRAAAKN
jgi:hypothetical protein